MAEGQLSGKVAIVTGAGQGIGKRDARELVQAGACVVLTDHNEADGRDAAKALGKNALFVSQDVTRECDWDTVIEATLKHFGSVDILVNNAGLYHQASWEAETLEGFRHLMDVNVTGTWLGIKKVIAPMRAAGGGTIINMGSGAGLKGTANNSAYGTSKFAVRGMTRYAANELGPYNIRVNVIMPGVIVETGMARWIEEDTKLNAEFLSRVPLGRFGKPADVAALVVFLASDASSYITGVEHTIDGGVFA